MRVHGGGESAEIVAGAVFLAHRISHQAGMKMNLHGRYFNPISGQYSHVTIKNAMRLSVFMRNP